MSNAQQIVAAMQLAMELIEDAAKVAGPTGAPSGVVYASLSTHGMQLNVYQQILGAMEKAGRIKVKHDCIHLA
jgi:hypothetical protein